MTISDSPNSNYFFLDAEQDLQKQFLLGKAMLKKQNHPTLNNFLLYFIFQRHHPICLKKSDSSFENQDIFLNDLIEKKYDSIIGNITETKAIVFKQTKDEFLFWSHQNYHLQKNIDNFFKQKPSQYQNIVLSSPSLAENLNQIKEISNDFSNLTIIANSTLEIKLLENVFNNPTKISLTTYQNIYMKLENQKTNKAQPISFKNEAYLLVFSTQMPAIFLSEFLKHQPNKSHILFTFYLYSDSDNYLNKYLSTLPLNNINTKTSTIPTGDIINTAKLIFKKMQKSFLPSYIKELQTKQKNLFSQKHLENPQKFTDDFEKITQQTGSYFCPQDYLRSLLNHNLQNFILSKFKDKPQNLLQGTPVTISPPSLAYRLEIKEQGTIIFIDERQYILTQKLLTGTFICIPFDNLINNYKTSWLAKNQTSQLTEYNLIITNKEPSLHNFIASPSEKSASIEIIKYDLEKPNTEN